LPLLEHGQTFSRYRIEQVLGQGGMGEVYAAYDTVLCRRVALKIMRPKAAASEAWQAAQVLREARAAAALNHRSSVAIFDVGEVEGTPFIAMELLSGRTLRTYVGDPSVEIEQKIRWLAEVARVLGAAHAAGLVHRDIKPENVMVCSDETIKVLDFGIAKRSELEGPPSSPAPICPPPPGPHSAGTGTGHVRGTPKYMAPERLIGEPASGRSDQYAWGLVAFELLSGKHPFDPFWRPDLPEPQLLSELVPGLPFELAAAIARSIARLPEVRFPSMEEAALALEPASSPRREFDAPAEAKPSARGDAGSGATTAPQITSSAWARATQIGGVLLLTIGAGGGLFAVMRGTRPALVVAAPAPSTPSSAPVPVTALPLPESTNREALAAYIEGLQALRGAGGHTQALLRFKKAVELEPTLASAHLRLAYLYADRDPNLARESYEHANELKASMSARDGELLHGLEPLVARSPSDAREAAKRLSAFADAHPGDVEVYLYLQFAAGLAGDMALVLSSGERGLVQDPEFTALVSSLGQAKAYSGDLVGASRALEQCVRAVGDDCSYMQALVLEQVGKCERLETTARSSMVARPTNSAAYELVAEGMLERGAPVVAVRQILEQRILFVRNEIKELVAHNSLFRFDVATGDFGAAEAEARAYEGVIAGKTSAVVHAKAARMLVDLYSETGRVKEAGDVARGMLEAKGWTAETRLEDEGISQDVTPSMLAAERAAGWISEVDMADGRARWLASWEGKLPPFFRPYLWVHGYADTVATPSDAVEAVTALKSFGGVPVFRPNATALIGRVYLLAGRTDEAMPWLESEARGCYSLARPFEHLRAHYWLGRGQEAKGDAASACRSYSEVIDRWGSARPRSVTADDASKRAQSLRCPRP
jgi:eukaryotic-like serine/threonine-protein kinase